MKLIKYKNTWIISMNWKDIYNDVYDLDINELPIKEFESKRPYKIHLFFENPIHDKSFLTAAVVKQQTVIDVSETLPFYLSRKYGTKTIIHAKNDIMAKMISPLAMVKRTMTLDDNSMVIGKKEYYISSKGKFVSEPV